MEPYSRLAGRLPKQSHYSHKTKSPSCKHYHHIHKIYVEHTLSTRIQFLIDNASYEAVSLFNMTVNGFSNYSANSEVRSTTKVAEGEHNQKNILRALKLKWLMKP